MHSRMHGRKAQKPPALGQKGASGRRRVFSRAQMAGIGLVASVVSAMFFLGARDWLQGPGAGAGGDVFLVGFPEQFAGREYSVSQFILEPPLREFKIRIEGPQTMEECAARYAIAQIKRGRELVASVFIRRNVYFGRGPPAKEEEGGGGGGETRNPWTLKREALEFYSLYVAPKHRRRGYAKRLLRSGVEAVLARYRSDAQQTILGLHVSPHDRHMEAAYALYRGLGFNKGAFVRYGPADLKHSVEVFARLGDPDRLVVDAARRGKRMRFLALFTTAHEYLEGRNGRPAPSSEHETAKRFLRTVLTG